MRELAWLACRAFELFSGTLLCLWLFMPASEADALAPLPALARTAILIGIYYVLSLYLVSCVVFGYFWRRQAPLQQAAVMAMAFALHALDFLDRTAAWDEVALMSAFAIGTGFVFAANALVEIRLHHLEGHG